jgi:hypothetical protein
MKLKVDDMKYSILITMILLMGGCAVDGKHQYSSTGACLTCWNNPITGETINHNQAQTQQIYADKQQQIGRAKKTAAILKQKAVCGETVKFNMSSNYDVDTVYTALKREFGYKNQNEKYKITNTEWKQWYLDKDPMRHEITPGVRYRMEDMVAHNGENNFINMEIEKFGSVAKIYVDYCDQGREGFVADIESSLKERISNAINGTQISKAQRIFETRTPRTKEPKTKSIYDGYDNVRRYSIGR